MTNIRNLIMWILIIFLCFMFAVTGIPVGINSIYLAYNSPRHSYPIYISKDISIYGYSSYTIIGELTNLSDKDITIERLNLTLYGIKNNTQYSGAITLKNIIIPANTSYELFSPGHQFENKYGYEVASGELTDVLVGECVINGKKTYITSYVNPDEQISTGILLITIGSIALLIGTIVLIYKIKTKFS